MNLEQPSLNQTSPQPAHPSESQIPISRSQSQSESIAPATQNAEKSLTDQDGIIYGNFLKRFGAAFIDGIILFIINFVLSLTISLGNALSAFGVSNGAAEFITIILSLVVMLISFTINIGYYLGFYLKKGATPGKMAMGLVLIKDDGGELNFITIILRETIGKFISVLLLGLGYLWIIWDERKQGWHDKIAGTLVVEKQSLKR